MSVIATAVRHLMAAGVTGEALVQAIADMEGAQPRDAVAEKRRAYDRERKRRAKVDVSGGIPVESAESAEKPSPSLSPQTPQTHPHPCNNKPASVKAHRLPSDWQPKPLTAELAQVVGSWPDGAEARELARFRDWAASATGTNSRKSDWDAAWRNWLRKAEDEGRYASRQPDGRGGFKPAVDPLVASILAKKARELSG